LQPAVRYNTQHNTLKIELILGTQFTLSAHSIVQTDSLLHNKNTNVWNMVLFDLVYLRGTNTILLTWKINCRQHNY